jgi:hypothetical protein
MTQISWKSWPVAATQGAESCTARCFADVHEPTPIEMETLQAYTVCAADYLKELLTGTAVAVKAIEMHSALCTLLDIDEFEMKDDARSEITLACKIPPAHADD